MRGLDDTGSSADGDAGLLFCDIHASSTSWGTISFMMSTKSVCFKAGGRRSAIGPSFPSIRRRMGP